jgi:hypothetical protein
MRDEPDLFFLNDDAVPFPDTPAYHNSNGYEREIVRNPEHQARTRAPRAPMPHSRGPSTQEPGNGDAAATQINRQRPERLTNNQKGTDTVQRRRAVFSEDTGVPPRRNTSPPVLIVLLAALPHRHCHPQHPPALLACHALGAAQACLQPTVPGLFWL